MCVFMCCGGVFCVLLMFLCVDECFELCGGHSSGVGGDDASLVEFENGGDGHDVELGEDGGKCGVIDVGCDERDVGVALFFLVEKGFEFSAGVAPGCADVHDNSAVVVGEHS